MKYNGMPTNDYDSTTDSYSEKTKQAKCDSLAEATMSMIVPGEEPVSSDDWPVEALPQSAGQAKTEKLCEGCWLRPPISQLPEEEEEGKKSTRQRELIMRWCSHCAPAHAPHRGHWWDRELIKQPTKRESSAAGETSKRAESWRRRYWTRSGRTRSGRR